jgi:Flp pilus assembly protein TadD
MGEERGWTYLQAGDTKSAEREFTAALKSTPAFYPAEISLGYVELAKKDPRAALGHFDRALERQKADVSALLGRGQASLALNREADALAAFEAAVAADPSLTDIAQRVEVLKFRAVQEGLTSARAAARAGRLDEAIRAYTAAIATSPESPFLYRELAGVERRNGNSDSALEHFRKAVALDPTDAASLIELGDLLDMRGDLDGAAKAYSDALALAPNADVQAKLENVRARAAVAKLPAEYRAIDEAPQITRGDLAALIGVRLAPLLQNDRRNAAVVVTDIRNHWAANWILAVTRAGVMDSFPNHTFQPRAPVRRVDLAQVVGRLLTRIAAAKPAAAAQWTGARLKFPDLAAGHVAYSAASAAVAAGIMAVMLPDGRFEPSRPVSGAEAVEAVRKLEALAGLPSPPRAER